MKALALAFLLAACTTTSAHPPLAYTPLTSGFVPLDAPGWSGTIPATAGQSPRLWFGWLPTPRIKAAPTPSPSARPLRTIGPVSRLSGVSTWWDSWGPGLYAAAGPRLRAAMGTYLHRYVTACSRGVCVRVRLTTSCACQPDTRLIDLSLDAFEELASPSLGVIPIEVSW